MSLSVPIEKQAIVMKSSLLKDDADLELGTPTVARLGQPTEVAGEWLPATPQHTDSMQWVPRVVPVACAEGGEPERGCHHSLHVA